MSTASSSSLWPLSLFLQYFFFRSFFFFIFLCLRFHDVCTFTPCCYCCRCFRCCCACRFWVTKPKSRLARRREQKRNREIGNENRNTFCMLHWRCLSAEWTSNGICRPRGPQPDICCCCYCFVTVQWCVKHTHTHTHTIVYIRTVYVATSNNIDHRFSV